MHANKTYLTQAIADQTGLSKRRSSLATSKLIEVLMHSLASGDEVKIAGFGKFYQQTLKARAGRHPKTGVAINIQARKTVRFKCYKQLKDKLNAPIERSTATSLTTQETLGLNLEPGMEGLPKGKAVVRVSGIPVCEFEVKDVSGNGTRMLAKTDSVVLRNLRVGRQIELHMVYAHRDRKAVLQRATITHITPQSKGDPYYGYVMVGIKVIDTLPIH